MSENIDPEAGLLGFAHSTEIGELSKALAIAQTTMPVVEKHQTNPFFKSKYADLAAIREAVQSLSKQGIAVYQVASGTSERPALTTILCHGASGQWIRGTFTMIPVKGDPQAVGSALSYNRRYSLTAMAFITTGDDLDDDGNAASGKGESRPEYPKTSKSINEKQMARLYAKMKAAGLNEEKLHDLMEQLGVGKHVKDLTITDYDRVCLALDQLAEKQIDPQAGEDMHMLPLSPPIIVTAVGLRHLWIEVLELAQRKNIMTCERFRDGANKKLGIKLEKPEEIWELNFEQLTKIKVALT